MDNFTPLKKAKKPVNRLFLIGNITLLTIIIFLGVFYVGKTKFPYKEKAYTRNDCMSKGYGWTDSSERCFKSSTGTYRNAFHYFCPNGVGGGEGCSLNPKLEQYQKEFCFSENCGVEQIDVFNTGETTTLCYASRFDNACQPTATPPEDTPTPTPTGELSPTPTITPTPTEVITNTPTPTATPTNTPTPTPTATPTITPTGTPGPTATNTPGPSATPIPVLCGTKDCDNATNPCRSGYSCVQAKDGSNYCTSPDFAEACKANPSYNSCCTAPGAPTATPTEIVLAKTSPTKAPVPVSGRPAWLMFLIPALIIIGSLIL
ncbi:MAG: hypothetical protein AAB437_04225 [Patescibacteria group bacterium]